MVAVCLLSIPVNTEPYTNAYMVALACLEASCKGRLYSPYDISDAGQGASFVRLMILATQGKGRRLFAL